MCVCVCACVCVGFSGSLWHSDLTGRHVYGMYKAWKCTCALL